jgi:integrase
MALKLVLRDSVWYAMGTVTDPTGEKIRVRKSTGFGRADKVHAEAVRRRILMDVASGKWGKAVGEAETLADAIRLFLQRPIPPGATDVSVLRRLERDLGHRPLARLKGVELMGWVTARGNMPGTVAREIGSIEACLNYARDLGVEVPEMKLKKPSVDDARTRWLTAEERDRLIGCCPETIRDLVVLLFWTGARLGEAFKLTWADVKLEGPKPCVTFRSKKGKGSKERERQVPLRTEARLALERARVERGRYVRPTDLVFVNSDGLAWERTAFYPHFDKAKDEAGITDFTPHDCRHTFASHLIQAGVRERVVAQLLGHTTLSLVMRYSHLAPDHLDEAIRALEAA